MSTCRLSGFPIRRVSRHDGRATNELLHGFVREAVQHAVSCILVRMQCARKPRSARWSAPEPRLATRHAHLHCEVSFCASGSGRPRGPGQPSKIWGLRPPHFVHPKKSRPDCLQVPRFLRLSLGFRPGSCSVPLWAVLVYRKILTTVARSQTLFACVACISGDQAP